jgi:hypothetical protein
MDNSSTVEVSKRMCHLNEEIENYFMRCLSGRFEDIGVWQVLED